MSVVRSHQLSFSLIKCLRYFSSVVIPKESDEILETREIAKELDEAEIEKKRNKSRLWPQHLRMLKNQVPYDEPKAEFHHALKYKRLLFGRYGNGSNLDPGTLYPNSSELEETVYYERIVYPNSLTEMLTQIKTKQEDDRRSIMVRQEKLSQNVLRIAQWKKEVDMRKEKKLKEVESAKTKREALLEEIRRKFGYNIDTKDARFQQAVLDREKEIKKKSREEKKAQKQGQLLAPEPQ